MNLFQIVMILQRELCNFVLFLSFYMISGAEHLPAHSVPAPGNWPISLKDANASG